MHTNTVKERQRDKDKENIHCLMVHLSNELTTRDVPKQSQNLNAPSVFPMGMQVPKDLGPLLLHS